MNPDATIIDPAEAGETGATNMAKKNTADNNILKILFFIFPLLINLSVSPSALTPGGPQGFF